jgi:hypothetical protein
MDGQSDQVQVRVTVENRSNAPVFVPSMVKDWDYDASAKTLTVDFSEPTPRPRPKSSDPNVSFGFTQHPFPLHAEMVEIPAHGKVDLKETRPIVTTRSRLLASGEYETYQTIDLSGLERVTVRVPVDATKFIPGEAEETEHARSRLQSWGKAVEKTFDVKLR